MVVLLLGQGGGATSTPRRESPTTTQASPTRWTMRAPRTAAVQG